MEVGIIAGLVGLLGVIAVYFWIVRRSQNETAQQEAQQQQQ